VNPLQELRDDIAPGTLLTADVLVRAGRARVRRRRTAIVGVAAAFVLVLTVGVAAVAGLRPPSDDRPVQPGPTSGPVSGSPVPAAPSCGSQLLPVPGDAETQAPVLSPGGRWAAAALASRAGVLLWSDGTAPVTLAADRTVFGMAGVSDKGEVAATAQGSDHRMYAMTFKSDYAVRLTLPDPDAQTAAYGVNGGGDVVGSMDLAGKRRPMLWRYRDPARPVVLTVPGGGTGTAVAIPAEGVVGGFIGDDATTRRPYLWKADGTGEALPLPAGVGEGAVNAVAGEWAVDFDNRVRWRLTQPGTPQPVALPEVADAVGRAMAVDGSVLYGGSGRAVVWGAGQPVELPLPAGYSRYTVGGISADGRTAGGLAQHLMNSGGGAPLLWHCGG
jgi:hypothetical protein